MDPCRSLSRHGVTLANAEGRIVFSNAAADRGLGLRFCRVVAEAHRGGIWVEDAEPTGARFCLELPTNDAG